MPAHQQYPSKLDQNLTGRRRTILIRSGHSGRRLEVVYGATVDATGEEAIEEEYGVELDLEGDAGYRGSFKD